MNKPDIKAEIAMIIGRNTSDYQAATEILDKIGEKIPARKDIPEGGDFQSRIDRLCALSFNECINEIRQALGLAKGG